MNSNSWDKRGSEVTVRRLTTGTGFHTNIYLETPFMDASSRYVLFTRSEEPDGPVEVWRADLLGTEMALVCQGADGITGMAAPPDQRYFYCVRRGPGQQFELRRTEIATLEQHSLQFEGEPSPLFDVLGSVSPDGRNYLAGATVPGGFGILRIDLETGERRIIHQGPELCNPHPQIEPGRGQDVLIQHNRGCTFDEQGACVHLVGEEGATLYLINLDGGDFRSLPVGKPFTLPVMGHECWIGGSGEILLTVTGGPKDEMTRQGNLLAVREGDAAARVVARGHDYNHPSASKDGRFFVSDTFAPGCPLVVGSIRTGQTRILCNSGASMGRPQFTHAHPYFSPDRRWVIFNSDGSGVPHVYAAAVPPGFLEELEEFEAVES